VWLVIFFPTLGKKVGFHPQGENNITLKIKGNGDIVRS